MIVALAIGLALGIQAFLVKPYQIPSGSMEPTLDIGQRVLVNRLAYKFGDPSVGDVVVFNPPVSADDTYTGPECGVPRGDGPCPEEVDERSDTNFIKRIVAGPGDELSIRQGQPVVNGEVPSEDFIKPCRGGGVCDLDKTITIPEGHYFMMGDNRGASQDSRYWGPVPEDWIIGKAFFTYWPVKKVGVL